MEDERFFAWLDGELGEEEAKLVSDQVAADPSLSSLADKHRALKKKLRRTFDTLPSLDIGPNLVSDRSAELDEQQDENCEQRRTPKSQA